MKEKICGIYCIQNKINKKLYIGGSTDCKSRKNNHLRYLRLDRHDNSRLQKDYNKYSEQNFSFIFLMKCSENELLKWEQFFYDCFQSYNRKFGYNFGKYAKHAMLGRKMTNKTKYLIGEIAKERFKKFGHPMLGRKCKSPMEGKTHSIEARKKIGAAQKGKFISEKHKKAISEASKKNTKPVLQFDLNNNLIKEYKGIIIAAKELNIERRSICSACRGRYKTAGGFIWKYKNAIQSTN